MMSVMVVVKTTDVDKLLLEDVSCTSCGVLLDWLVPLVISSVSLTRRLLVDLLKRLLVCSLLAVAVALLVAMAADSVDVAMVTSLLGAALLDCSVVSSTDAVLLT